MIGLLGWTLAIVVIAVRVRRRRQQHVPRALALVKDLTGATCSGPARRGEGVVWHALTEYGLAHFENARVTGHTRCSCEKCTDAAMLRCLARTERDRRRNRN